MYNDNYDKFGEIFEMLLKTIAGFIEAEERGEGFLTKRGEPRANPRRVPLDDILNVKFLKPARSFSAEEFARLIGIILKDELIADISINDSKINIKFPYKAFTLRISENEECI